VIGRRIIGVVLVPWAAFACGGEATESPSLGNGSQNQTGPDASTDAGGGEESVTVTQCSWPASLNPPEDAGPWSWVVAHYYLSCKDGALNVNCLSNTPTTCPSIVTAPVGGSATDCVDQCNADEYAVGAGGPPQQLPDGGFTFPPTPVLPTNCRTVGSTGAGSFYSCCPCQ
jgi:hypothetical protein